MAAIAASRVASSSGLPVGLHHLLQDLAHLRRIDVDGHRAREMNDGAVARPALLLGLDVLELQLHGVEDLVRIHAEGRQRPDALARRRGWRRRPASPHRRIRPILPRPPDWIPSSAVLAPAAGSDWFATPPPQPTTPTIRTAATTAVRRNLDCIASSLVSDRRSSAARLCVGPVWPIGGGGASPCPCWLARRERHFSAVGGPIAFPSGGGRSG